MPSRSTRSRGPLSSQVETPLGGLTVVNTPLSFVPGWNRLQLRRLRRDLTASAGALGRVTATSAPALPRSDHRALTVDIY